MFKTFLTFLTNPSMIRDEVITEVRVPAGDVSQTFYQTPFDTVSSTGAQKCRAGQYSECRFLVLWLESAPGQELNQISVVKSVGRLCIHEQEGTPGEIR